MNTTKGFFVYSYTHIWISITIFFGNINFGCEVFLVAGGGHERSLARIGIVVVGTVALVVVAVVVVFAVVVTVEIVMLWSPRGGCTPSPAPCNPQRAALSGTPILDTCPGELLIGICRQMRSSSYETGGNRNSQGVP